VPGSRHTHPYPQHNPLAASQLHRGLLSSIDTHGPPSGSPPVRSSVALHSTDLSLRRERNVFVYESILFLVRSTHVAHPLSELPQLVLVHHAPSLPMSRVHPDADHARGRKEAKHA
jgi:hypothetical protein